MGYSSWPEGPKTKREVFEITDAFDDKTYGVDENEDGSFSYCVRGGKPFLNSTDTEAGATRGLIKHLLGEIANLKITEKRFNAIKDALR